MMHKRCDIRDYLDAQIVFWRGQRDQAQQNEDTDTMALAVHYVDAYQDVRIAIFEEPLDNVRTVV